ncbi:MAG TPA: DUF3576 domain-containing protein [Caulobacterales bacterium]|jgi:hypothetical protein|nr:DUF3576 domain-containing protein [Caulobacterales bacterium]
MALASCGHNPDRVTGQPRHEGGGFLGIGKKSKAADAGAQIGVNSFLWRATLETLSFMPLASADQIGGVVTTDWYANPEAPRERFKATVYILDTRLRADGLKVAINRQTLAANGWADAPSDPEVALQIENQILVRARELRLSTQG